MDNNSIDFNKVSKKFSDLRDKVVYTLSGDTRRYFRQDEYNKLLVLRGMNMLDYQIKTYPNLYGYIRYNITSPALMNYVISKIQNSLKNNYSFNPDDIRKESMGVMFKSLTGKNLGNLTRSQFRFEFRKYMFGGVGKTYLRIHPDRLFVLTYKIPDILHYFDYNLLGTEAEKLSKFVDDFGNQLDKVSMYNTELAASITIYKTSLFYAMEDVLFVHKVIKTGLIDLNDEYYRVLEYAYRMAQNDGLISANK